MWSIERRRFQWPWITLNPVFKVTLYFDAEYLKRWKLRPYLLWKVSSKPHPSLRMVPVWMTFSDLLKVMIIQRQIAWKWYNIQLYLQWPTNRKSCMICRTTPFSMTSNDPYPSFKVTPFFDAEYVRNGTTYRHSSIIEILIGTHTRPTQQCHFEWPCVILSYLAEYSLTRSVAQSLCDR